MKEGGSAQRMLGWLKAHDKETDPTQNCTTYVHMVVIKSLVGTGWLGHNTLTLVAQLNSHIHCGSPITGRRSLQTTEFYITLHCLQPS